MAWPNEAYEQFLRALLVLKEVHGDEEAIRILQQEVARETVVGRLRAAAKQPEAAAGAIPDTRACALALAIAKESLRFYSEGRFHDERGEMARTTLAQIAKIEAREAAS